MSLQLPNKLIPLICFASSHTIALYYLRFWASFSCVFWLNIRICVCLIVYYSIRLIVDLLVHTEYTNSLCTTVRFLLITYTLLRRISWAILDKLNTNSCLSMNEQKNMFFRLLRLVTPLNLGPIDVDNLGQSSVSI